MFITVEEFDGKTIMVQLSQKMTSPKILDFQNSRSAIGQNILALANSENYQQFKALALYKDCFDIDKEIYEDILAELQLNLDSLHCEATYRKEKDEGAEPFPLCVAYTFEQDANEGFSSQLSPLFVKCSFDLSITQDSIYTFRQIFEVDTFRQAVAIEFMLYLKAYREDKVQVIKQCANCGRYFLATVRSDRKYCSDTCREKKHQERIGKNPCAQKYRSLSQNVSKDLTGLPNDDPLRGAYKEWKRIAKQESCLETREGEYCSADEYRTTMRKKWNEMKGELK